MRLTIQPERGRIKSLCPGITLAVESSAHRGRKVLGVFAPPRSRQALPHAGEVEILFAQTLLLYRRLRCGLRLDSRSLRNLARLAEKIAVAEEHRP